MRRTFPLIVGLALVVAACAPREMTAESTNTSTTTANPSSPVTPSPTTTSAPGRTTTDTDDTLWAYQEWSVPPDLDPYDAVWGDSGMVVLGYRALRRDASPTPNGLWFSDGTEWTETLIQDVTSADEYGFTPDVTSLVWFGGRYLAFLMGDSTTIPGRASMLTSDDGRSWNLEYLGAAPTAALPAGLYATPESPPWPGTSAVARVAIYDNEITAVGWTMLGTGADSVSVPVIWRSTDGRAWSTSALPNANFDNEWASDVAAGPLGYLVEVAGPVHQSAMLWYSPDGADWTYVGDRFDDQWRALVSIAVGEESLLAVLMDLENDGGQSLSLWRATNGLDWEAVESPIPLRATSEGSPLADLVNTRQGIVVVATADDTIELWRSLDGWAWTKLQSIAVPPADRLGRVFPGRAVPFSTGDRLSLQAMAPGTVARWIQAVGTKDVMLVPAGDVLNVRSGPGVENDIVATLAPTATGVALTGREAQIGSSTWAEIVTEDGTGWVNEHYLAKTDSTANPFSDTLAVDLGDELAAVFAGRGDLTETAGTRGIYVAHHDQPRPFTNLDGLLTDSTLHAWAGTGCAPEDCPDETPKLTFAEGVADSFLGAWTDDDRQVAVDEVIPGGNGMLPDFIVPTEFKNLHYVAVKDPGDDPDYGGLDWYTWYVYFTYENDVPVVLGMSIDAWAP